MELKKLYKLLDDKYPSDNTPGTMPLVKPLSATAGLAIFGGLSIIGLSIGATIGTYVFFGVATLTGLIAIIESNKYAKYIVVKSNKTIDVIIFIGSVVAIYQVGVTAAAALTFAGLGYTLVYAQYIRTSNTN